MHRRTFLLSLGAGLLACRAPAPNAPSSAPSSALATLEARAGGRLGVFALDTGDGRSLALRADERFAMCSTFKLMLAALVLREADAGRLSLDEALSFSAADMVYHAPVTSSRLAEGKMRVEELAQATQETSDNVAANLLLRRLGGPAWFTASLRQLGDPETRLDREEPEMNLVPPGELRDTTTPRAMARTVATVLTGGILSQPARDTLLQWMRNTQTGKKRLRAGLPPAWDAGDKTGTGQTPSMANKHNDVAILWPPGQAPVVVAAYYEASGYFDPLRPEDDAVLAEVGREVASWAVTAR